MFTAILVAFLVTVLTSTSWAIQAHNWRTNWMRSMVPLGIIVLSLAYFRNLEAESTRRARETVLKNNLFTLRSVIDEYTDDKQRGPRTLGDLVESGYLRSVPIDPITGISDSWRLTYSRSGIADVHSSASGKSSDGSAFAEW